MNPLKAVPATPVVLDWPQAEGLLEQVPLQLWWMTALLDCGHRRLSAFAMFMKVGEDGLAVTIVLSDLDTGTEIAAQRAMFPLSDVKLGTGQVDVTAGTASLSGSFATGYQLTADLGDDAGFALALQPTRPALFNCATGEFPWDDEVTTKQYAVGGLTARGQVRIGGTTAEATGSAWHDRQWWERPFAGPPRFGWLGLWLDNGDTLSVWDHTVTRPDGKAWATVVRKDGTHIVTPLTPWALAAPATYTTHLGNTVPAGWSLEFPGLGMWLEIQQLTAQDDPGQDFYTGALTVRGVHDGLPLTGRGLADLVGLRGSWDTAR